MGPFAALGLEQRPQRLPDLHPVATRRGVHLADVTDGRPAPVSISRRENGEPIRPERVLRRFRTLTAAAGLPMVRVHDLRDLAASTMIIAGAPLPIMSKTLRHSTVRLRRTSTRT